MIEILSTTEKHFEEIKLGERHRFDSIEKHSSPYSVTLKHDGEIIAIMGGALFVAGVFYVWAFISDSAAKCGVSFTKIVRRIIDFYISDLSLRRVWFVVREDFKMGMRWAKALGFSQEGLMKKFMPDGSNAWLYARIV